MDRLCRCRAAALAIVMMVAGSCSQTLDAGVNRPPSPLPVDGRNPIVLANDGSDDNWQGEYAALLASGAGVKLQGIVVNASPAWTDIEANIAGWRQLVAAARASGLRNIPDPITSIGGRLGRPSSGNIDGTTPNRSEGALFIVEAAHKVGLPQRPLVVLTGGRLTDVADAYLVDPSIVDRVVVVSSLGTTSASGGEMGVPNGEMDPWAATIVTARFRYVQVSAFYDQLTDVPVERLPDLPANAFGDWIAAKQPKIWSMPVAADQVAIAAVCVPGFVVTVERVSPLGLVGAGATAGPDLGMDPDGNAWLVRESSGAAATSRFWQLLLDPKTYGR